MPATAGASAGRSARRSESRRGPASSSRSAVAPPFRRPVSLRPLDAGGAGAASPPCDGPRLAARRSPPSTERTGHCPSPRWSRAECQTFSVPELAATRTPRQKACRPAAATARPRGNCLRRVDWAMLTGKAASKGWRCSCIPGTYKPRLVETNGFAHASDGTDAAAAESRRRHVLIRRHRGRGDESPNKKNP
jgi:hypothetical protein